jgi:hypothetical protein
MSPALLGNNIVLPFLARLPKAATYCSAIRNPTASVPPCRSIALLNTSTPFAVAPARVIIAAASPCACNIDAVYIKL